MENECVCVRARVCVCVGPKNKRITTTGSRTTSQSASFEKPSASFNERVIPSLLLWGGGGVAMASQIGVRLLPPEWRLRFQAPKPIGEINKSNSRMNHFTVQWPSNRTDELGMRWATRSNRKWGNQRDESNFSEFCQQITEFIQGLPHKTWYGEWIRSVVGRLDSLTCWQM